MVAKLLSEGSAEFSQDGLNIKTSYDNGCFTMAASFESPVQDEDNSVKKLVTEFEEYVKSLNDEFFLEVAESFEDGRLREIQDKFESGNMNQVREGIDEFMSHAKFIANSKIESINSDIEKNRKEFEELNEIKDSYVHVIHKVFS